MDHDRRNELRMLAQRPGKIVVDGAGDEIDCLIREVSLSGASVECAAPVMLPDRFILSFAGDPNRYRCEVIWRRDTRAGVKFLNV